MPFPKHLPPSASLRSETMKFQITLHIVVEQTFEVEADDEFEAVDIARDLFNFEDADIIDSDADVNEILKD
jgi:hypothetical protein